MMNTPRLVVTGQADQAGRVLALPAPEMMIGHSDTADLILEDRFVSRRHALITIDPAGAVTIRDLNSTSGTFVNEERIEGPRVLRAGDRVRFADLVARFEPGTAPGAGTQTRDAPAQATALTPAPGTPDREVHPGAVNEQNLIYTVIGTVSTAGLPGVGGLTVDLVDKNVGGDQLLHTTQTGGDGSYGFSNLAIPIRYLLAHRKTLPDLQARVSAGGQFFAASLVSYSAPATVTLDVVLPPGSAGLPSEYEVLTANLAAAYAGDLGGLQEGKGRAGHHLPRQQNRLVAHHGGAGGTRRAVQPAHRDGAAADRRSEADPGLAGPRRACGPSSTTRCSAPGCRPARTASSGPSPLPCRRSGSRPPRRT